MNTISTMTYVSNCDLSLLKKEACYLHLCFFHKQPDEIFVSNYLAAHIELPELRYFPEEQLRSVRIIVESGLNAMGIEPWLRRSGIRHPLTSKLMLVAYLSECDSRHRDFSRKSSGRYKAWLCMFLNLFRSVLSLSSGYISKKRYKLV